MIGNTGSKTVAVGLDVDNVPLRAQLGFTLGGLSWTITTGSCLGV